MPIIDRDDVTHVIDHLWAPLRTPARIARRTIDDAIADDIAGEAAKFAYFSFLSLFPLILLIFALTGFVGGNAAFDRITDALQRAVPDFAWQFVRDMIREITERRRPGVLSIGVILAFWAASRGVSALTHGLDRMYDVVDRRSWIRRRLLSVAVVVITVVLAVLVAAVLAPSWLAAVGLGDEWRIARWPLAFAVVTALMWLAYRYFPARDQNHVKLETLIGAITGTALWLLGTLGFRLYVSSFSRYGRLYGWLGAIIVLLLWFYLTGIAILAGGELARVLEERREPDDAQSTGATSDASRS